MGASSEVNRGASPRRLAGAAPPFVGRTLQFDWLERGLGEAIVGRPRARLIAGEAGIGKTRLVNELRAIALRSRVQVFYGRCYEDLSLPYLPFIEALQAPLTQAAAGPENRFGSDAAIISRLLGGDATSAPAVPSPALAQTEQDKLRLFLAVSRATVKLAQASPTLLVLEDLHWADGPSLDLLVYLVFAVSDASVWAPVPLLIIGTYRPTEPETRWARVLARLQREDICQTIELSGLSESEINELLCALDLQHPSHQLVTTVSRATQGNPLFVQEVLHHLMEQGALQERGGHVVTTMPAEELRLPEQITGAIAARTYGVSAGCRRVLSLGSFLGHRFSLPLLSAVSNVSEEQLLGLLEEAMQHRLLLSEGQAFQFAHPLIRHVFYNEPSAPRRQRIHCQIAQTLEHLYAGTLDEHVLEIAHHLVGAGPSAETEKVVKYARRAGDQAFAVFGWAEAARYYEAALAAAGSTGQVSAHDRAALHHGAGIAHYRDMDVGPCLHQYEEAIAAYQEAGDVQRLAEVLMAHVRAYLTLASVPYGTLVDVQALEDILEQLGGREPQLRGRIMATIAEAYWHARQTEKAQRGAQDALEIGQYIQDDSICFHASHVLALAQLQGMHVREALESWQSALVYIRRTGDLWLQGWPLQRIPMLLTWLGQIDDAEACVREAGTLARKTQDWGDHSLAVASLVSVAVARGDFEAAERHAHETMMMLQRSRYPWGGVLALPALAGARFLRGAWAEAEDAIGILVEPGRVFEEPGPVMQLVAWVYRKLLRAHAGAVDEVRQDVDESLVTALQEGGPDISALSVFCALVQIADLITAPALAEQAYQALSVAAARGVVFSSGWLFLIPRVLGVAASVNRWWDKAEAHFQTAIEAATKAGARPELGHACLDYARMLAVRGAKDDHHRAIEWVRRAAPIFNELSMEPLCRQAMRLAEELKISLPRARADRPAGPEQLSAHEIMILRHIAWGRSDAEIADEMVLSLTTAAQQVSAIIDKIGVGRRAAVAAYAAAHGLLDQTPPRTWAGPAPERGSAVGAGKVAEPAADWGPTQSPVIILFTDMEGSTALIDRLGDARAQELLRAHNAIIRDCLRAHHGSEIQHTGDGLMLSFASAYGAIECAVAIQRALARRNKEHPETPIRVRIGMHAGEPIADKDQLFGAAVNAAARICARARGGQILVSDVIRQLAAGKSVAFSKCGRFALKGFSTRFLLHEVHWENEYA